MRKTHGFFNCTIIYLTRNSANYMRDQPLVSVIITTRNEEKNIESCIQSILKQTYLQFHIEIIVVDNNSTDKTKTIALRFTKLIFNIGPERSAQRNFGMRLSKGKYFLYLDADMVLSPRVIEECVNVMEHHADLLGLYIPEIVSGTNFWSQVRRFERSFYNATVIDCVRFIRLSAAKKVGGFDEELTGPEDWDFDKKIRLSGKVALINAPLYHNESTFRVTRYASKKGYYAKSFSIYINKWSIQDPDIKKQFSPLYRFVGVFIEKGKWKILLSQPHLAFGMYYLRLLVCIQYIAAKLKIK